MNEPKGGGQLSTKQSNSDIVWGCAAIARVIGRTERQAFYLCSRGELPVRKVGGRWVGSRERLKQHITGEGA